MSHTVLRIDASARVDGSVTRKLADAALAGLGATELISRDLQNAVPQIDEAWVGANFTPPDQRSDAQRDTLTLSDQLVGELQRADTIVIAAPVYNFGVPASLKAWIDQVARAGLTFRYTPDGPVGLLQNKKAILLLASGGTRIGSEIDFASGYLRHVLGFLGITDVETIFVDPDHTAEAVVAGLAGDRPRAAA